LSTALPWLGWKTLIFHHRIQTMPMFRVLIGDLFESQAQVLVNAVNCVGVMGKGIAVQFKKRFPAMFEDYARRCDQKLVRTGEPYLYRDISGAQIVNFPTKDHWRSPSLLVDIERGLDYFAARTAAWGVASVALPSLGCGNGGLEWSKVGPLIYRKLQCLPIDIEVYAPYGTHLQQLTQNFLGRVHSSLARTGSSAQCESGARVP
jgi:O-acetyl-ADP-ribose deacetylase (regulator of RNase III)